MEFRSGGFASLQRSGSQPGWPASSRSSARKGRRWLIDDRAQCGLVDRQRPGCLHGHRGPRPGVRDGRARLQSGSAARHRRSRFRSRSRGLPILVDRLLSKCSDNLSLLAAPATLDRLYDFPETAFDSIIDVMRASTPCIVLDLPHAWNAWTRRMLIGADEVMIVAAPRSGQFCATPRTCWTNIRSAASERPSSESVVNGVGLLKRPEIAVADFAKTVELEPGGGDSARRQTLRRRPANNGQMIAEIEPTTKSRRSSPTRRVVTGKAEVRRSKRSLFER